MQEQNIQIGRIPAVVYGTGSENVWLFIHGKQGCKEEGASFAETACANGWQVISIDLPEHGERRGGAEELVPWTVVPELRSVMEYIRKRWRRTALRATSIGAWFALLAFGDAPPEQALLVSPVLDMEALIRRMMDWAGVTEAELEARRTIPTAFGETLSWDYWQYVRAHPIQSWDCPTAILYAVGDALTERETLEDFAARFGCALTVYEEGEHWFHTPEQFAVLKDWERLKTAEPLEVVAALIWDSDRFLACQRPENKARGGQWEFVGGKVEPGETKPQALVRECREELGITVSVTDTFLELTHRYPDVVIRLTVLHAAITEGTPRLLEHQALRWVTVEEMEKMPFCPADRKIIERLRQI